MGFVISTSITTGQTLDSATDLGVITASGSLVTSSTCV
jgi:hypothetical protein